MNRTLFTAVTMAFATAAFAQGTTTIGGYGELHYNKLTYAPGKPYKDLAGTFDFHRFVLFFGHDFSDKVSFKSEFEIEHTQIKSSNTKSEIALEQAYVDVKFIPEVNLRAGIVLIPVGFINEYHEPSTFNGVERPSLDRVIIPSTWREAGAGVFGKIGEGIEYRAYVMAGLKPDQVTSKGIRDSRQSAYYSTTSDMAVTGRIEYMPTLNLKTGLSFYASTLSNAAVYGDTLSGVALSLFSGDFRFDLEELHLRGTVVYSLISDAEKLNAKFNKSAGSAQFGYNFEAGYNLLPLFTDSEQALIIFGRFDRYDTQSSRSDNAKRLPGTQYNDYTAGLTWKPIDNVAFKTDYQFISQSGQDKMTQQFNMGVGYFFY